MKLPARIVIVVPLGVLVLAISLLIGCLPVPGDFKQPGGMPRPESYFGDARSNAPLKTGAATQRDVVNRLGLPEYSSDDGTVAVYSYQLNFISTLYPACFFFVERDFSERFLLVRYSSDGTLKSWDTYKVLRDLELDIAPIVIHPANRPIRPPIVSPSTRHA